MQLRFLVDGLLVFENLAARVLGDAIVFNLEVQKTVRVNPLLVIDGAVDFSDTHKSSSLLDEELRCPVANIAETLHNEGFPLYSSLNAQLAGHLRMVQYLSGSIENSQPC